MKLNSVYVGVEEMDRALAFYRELFETEPSQVDERYSAFEFEGVEAAHDRIEPLAPALVHDDIFEVGEYRTFQFLDTEGSRIEVFSTGSG